MATIHPQVRNASGTRSRTILRRNLQARGAGAGYAAITALWLGLLLSRGAPTHGIAEGLLGILVGTGLALAFWRDDLIVDSARQTLDHVRGLPGLAQTTRHELAEFDRVTIEERRFVRHDDELSRPSQRVSSIVVLANSRTGRTLSVWEAETEDTESSRAQLLKQSQRRAKAVAEAVGLPFAE